MGSVRKLPNISRWAAAFQDKESYRTAPEVVPGFLESLNCHCEDVARCHKNRAASCLRLPRFVGQSGGGIGTVALRQDIGNRFSERGRRIAAVNTPAAA